MEQILEYSFARVLIRLAGVVLVISGVLSFGTAVIYFMASLVFGEVSVSGYNLAYALSYGIPSVAMALLGLYLARDGHLLARIVTSGMHGRCRKCGYDIRALTTGACPECATPLPHAPDPHGAASISGIRHDPSNTPADGR